MDKLELLLFNVGHGLSVALIEHPSKYMVVIDLGSEDDFSPLRYLSSYRGLRADILYITHPHGDHISDIDSALAYETHPIYICYQEYDWQDVINRESAHLRDKVRNYIHFIHSSHSGSYNGSARLRFWYYSPDNAKYNFGDSDYINNSSLIIVYTWKAFKICITGDQHTAAMEHYCNSDGFVTEAKDTDIFIAPHHGHKQGFTSLWPQKIGRPYITLVSVQSEDPHVAQGYNSSNFARSWKVNDTTRYCLTTRSDGNISITMSYNENNRPIWHFDTGW